MKFESLADKEPEWRVEATKCNGCGDCVAVCPVKAIKMVKSVPVLSDPETCCRESCHECVRRCKPGAITRRIG